MERDVKSRSLVSPLRLIFKRAGASLTHLNAGRRHLTVFHREPAERRAEEASGCICLDVDTGGVKCVIPPSSELLLV